MSTTSNPAWSPEENKLIVAAYFGLLAKSNQGFPINKSATRRQLIADMRQISFPTHGRDVIRTEASVEFKMRNISGVLADKHAPWLKGYLPLPNYQSSLSEAAFSLTGGTFRPTSTPADLLK